MRRLRFWPPVAAAGRTRRSSDDVALLERQLDSIQSDLNPRVEQEVRDDYAEIAAEANCPGYNNPDN